MKPSVQELCKGIRSANRRALAQAITLCESRLRADQIAAAEVLDQVRDAYGRARRIGISGTPGVGKSTMINRLGMEWIQAGHKVAVLAIDPSSPVSGGSILGDKTRMVDLATHKDAFIRPSPSQGILGGLSRHTMENILLCEAAGYDMIIIETVGVGQSEVSVKDHCDLMLALQLPNAGDDLQSLKRGILEMVDILVIHKADGPYRHIAEQCARSCQSHLKSMTQHRRTSVNALAMSSLDGSGYPQLLQEIDEFFAKTDHQQIIQERRLLQKQKWFDAELSYLFGQELLQHPRMLPQVEQSWQKIQNQKGGVKFTARQLYEQTLARFLNPT